MSATASDIQADLDAYKDRVRQYALDLNKEYGIPAATMADIFAALDLGEVPAPVPPKPYAVSFDVGGQVTYHVWGTDPQVVEQEALRRFADDQRRIPGAAGIIKAGDATVTAVGDAGLED